MPDEAAGGVPRAAFRYLVTGRVQGVGYRYFVMREAGALGVTGFARNLPDGRVEVVGEATPETLVEFEEKLREGPSFAAVAAIEKASIAARADHGFHIR